MKAFILSLFLLLTISCSAATKANLKQTTFVAAGATIGLVGGPITSVVGAVAGDWAGEVFFPEPIPNPPTTVVYVDPSKETPVVFTNTTPTDTTTFDEKLGGIMFPPQTSWFESLFKTLLKYAFYLVLIIVGLPLLFKKGRKWFGKAIRFIAGNAAPKKWAEETYERTNKLESLMSKIIDKIGLDKDNPDKVN